MGDSWNIIGWIVLVLAGLAVVAVAWIIFRAYIDQWRVNWRRRRADGGKLKCQSEACSKTSRYVTPNGYFCEDHEGENSKKKVLTGSVMYAHPLAYTITSTRR